MEQLNYAPFDERLSVVHMLIGRLGSLFKEYFVEDQYVTILYEYLRLYKENLNLEEVTAQAEGAYETLRKAEQLTKLQDKIYRKVVETLERFGQMVQQDHLTSEAAFARVKEEFQQSVEVREQVVEHTLQSLNHAFDFMEDAFGDSQEMVAFVTELNTNYYSIQFLKDNDCDKYYRYNKRLLFDEQQQEILKELDEVEQDLNTALK